MPRYRIVLCASHKSHCFVIERKVLRLYRQQSNEWLNNTATHERRQALVELRPAKSAIHGITGEQFIATVTAQRDCYVLPCESRQKIRRHKRRIAEGLVHPRADFVDEIRGQVRAQTFLVMICAEKLR